MKFVTLFPFFLGEGGGGGVVGEKRKRNKNNVYVKPKSRGGQLLWDQNMGTINLKLQT